MDSKPRLRLPTVDFSKTVLKTGTHEWDSVKLQVKVALEEYGCFEAIYDKVPTDLHKAVYSSLEELFDLPLSTKLKSKSTNPAGHGYIGQYPSVPLYESMGINDAINIENVESLASIMWPEKGNANFCKTITSFAQQMSELDQIVRRMVLESLGVEKYYEEHIESTNYHMRVMKYEGPKTSDTKVGLTPHTDKSTVTILSQNQVNGLEVQSKDGTWIDAKISPNSFIVVIGLD
ncbi:hypothetical protein AQUCO_05500051v1 [Aquilegia coerulea]|uniref:Fe2OG dioxygenase domain-containing protein n=1 Tax=Aquilegia coerulea TaxID=218851 RepID=A0A2G5CGR1_AQUCA|nr:hypothetical protein AQUCO_05500051v1 [Aquilegia coerulea]